MLKYGPQTGIGLVGFIHFNCWCDHYHDRPWFRDRDRWDRDRRGWNAGLRPEPPHAGIPDGRPGSPQGHDRPVVSHDRPPQNDRPSVLHAPPRQQDRPGGPHPQPTQRGRPDPPRMQRPQREHSGPPNAQQPRQGRPDAPRQQPEQRECPRRKTPPQRSPEGDRAHRQIPDRIALGGENCCGAWPDAIPPCGLGERTGDSRRIGELTYARKASCESVCRRCKTHFARVQENRNRTALMVEMGGPSFGGTRLTPFIQKNLPRLTLFRPRRVLVAGGPHNPVYAKGQHAEFPMSIAGCCGDWVEAQPSTLARHQAEQGDQPVIVAA